MKTISGGVVALVTFTILIALVVNFYGDLKTSYVPASETAIFDATNADIDGKNIGERMKDIVVLNSISSIVSAIQNTNPSASLADIAGNLLLISIGGIFSIIGIFTAPFEIAYILESHYSWIPPFFLNGLLLILVVYIYFNYEKMKQQQGGL